MFKIWINSIDKQILINEIIKDSKTNNWQITLGEAPTTLNNEISFLSFQTHYYDIIGLKKDSKMYKKVSW